MKKLLIVLLVLIICLAPISVSAAEYNTGELPYLAYTYDNESKPVAIPTPYEYTCKVTGENLEIGSFSGISDIFYYDENEKIYIVDSANSRIVILNKDYQLSGIIDSIIVNGERSAFKNPSGICVRDGIIYISDTDNSRIVTLNSQTNELIKIFEKPEIALLGDNYEFKPTKLAIGITGQMYVVGKDINSGFIMLDSDGQFQSFVGAPEVKVDFIDEIWKMFMTKKQKEGFNKSVPTEYNSITFDEQGFIYATTQSEDVQPIVRLNLQGQDILKYDEEYPQGDFVYENNKSAFIDAAITKDGVYFALDSLNGRIFAYNKFGKMLFTFGGKGTKNGLNFSPSSIELVDNHILVTDMVNGVINVYALTRFGAAILEGDSAMHRGDYEDAEKEWEYVYSKCPSYTLAINSFGKLSLYNKDYKDAMKYFKASADKDGYSDAFKMYRSEMLYENYTILIFVVIFVAALIFLYKKVFLKTKIAAKIHGSAVGKALAYSNYCLVHPFDGFWCLKREKRGNLASANIILFLFLIVFCANIQFSGYLFINGQPEDVKVILSLLSVIVIMLCYCISNWGFTSLMDGKGTFKDIYISMAFALKPYIYGGVILFILSHCLSLKESFIYTTVEMIILLWVFMLLFFGMMMTHDYSLGNGLKTMVLTVVGMALIIFVGLVFTNLFEDIIGYFVDIYRELLYRTL